MAPSRRQFLGGLAVAGADLAWGASPARAEEPLRIAFSLVDVPRMWGGPDGGFEGMRFGGYPVYDALLSWDLLQSAKPSNLVPSLAESWAVDPQNQARWIVKLRSGVTFHDGSAFDADAAVWNFASVLDDKAAQYNAQRAGMIRSRLPSIAGAEKIDERTIAIMTRGPDATLPYQLPYLLFVSPAQLAKLGGDWSRFAMEPSGTGPFSVAGIVPRTRLDLVRNEHYWDKQRIPKVGAVTLLPIPDATARVAALQAGQVDIVESVPPDAIATLKATGLQVLTNIYPHIWKWTFSSLPDSPFADLKVRKAANLAIDRDGLVDFLNGTAVAAKGLVDPTSPWFGHPRFELRYDPAAAKQLLAEAGFGPNKRVKATIVISNSGGGQMQPLQMNDFIQANLAEVGIDVEYQIVDFITLFTHYIRGAKAPSEAGIAGVNLASPMQDPTTGFVRGFESTLVSPRGSNWGCYSNPEVDDALHAAQQAFDPAALDAALAKVHALLVDDAAGLIVVHDLNPRGLSSRVKGFVQPQNWFVDLTSVSVG